MKKFKELIERNKKIKEEITKLKLLADDAFKKINLNYADTRFYEKLYHAGVYKEEIIYNIKRMNVGSKKLNRAIDKLFKLKIQDDKMIKLEELKSEKDKAWDEWTEASNILYQTSEYKAKAKAEKACEEATNILYQTPEYKAKAKAEKACEEATNILYQTPESKAANKAAVKARDAWREASKILFQTTEYKAEEKAFRAWREDTNILAKTPEAKAAKKAWDAWDALEAADAKLREETK
jgi:hypothetical protein